MTPLDAFNQGWAISSWSYFPKFPTSLHPHISMHLIYFYLKYTEEDRICQTGKDFRFNIYKLIFSTGQTLKQVLSWIGEDFISVSITLSPESYTKLTFSPSKCGVLAF